MVNERELKQILDLIENELPREKWKERPGGYSGQIEAAIIDAVLSIQANYGSAHNGVRGAVGRYKDAVNDTEPNDLKRLAAYDPLELQELLNDQQISGRTKASAIIEAAGNLAQLGVQNDDDFDAANKGQKKAYTSVHGLGPVTWEYFGMLLNKPGVKADTWIIRFVERAVGRTDVSPGEAHDLVVTAADRLGVNPIELDHALWDHERRR